MLSADGDAFVAFDSHVEADPNEVGQIAALAQATCLNIHRILITQTLVQPEN